MAYSDYGAYVWFKKDGMWARKKESEDSSIKNFLADNPPPEDRPLEDATGLKFDVLLHADGMKEDSDWATEHAHHAVFGDNKVIVSAHKQWLDCLWIDGHTKKIKITRWAEEHTIRAEEQEWRKLLPDGYSLDMRETDHGVAILLKTATDEEWLAYVGYGIGKHWWQDEEGYALEPNYATIKFDEEHNAAYYDKDDNKIPDEEAYLRGLRHYPGEEQALAWCISNFQLKKDA